MSEPLRTTRILVAGIGNIFRGDDGFGPEVLRRYAAAHPDVDGVRIVDYGIRGMHLAYDLLDGYDALVIVDALPGQAGSPDTPPGALTVLEVGADDLGDADFDPHGMNPVAVLASLGSLGGELPTTYVVGCCPASLADEMGLTPVVTAAIDDAVRLTAHVVDDLLSGRPVLGGERACVSESPAR